MSHGPTVVTVPAGEDLELHMVVVPHIHSERDSTSFGASLSWRVGVPLDAAIVAAIEYAHDQAEGGTVGRAISTTAILRAASVDRSGEAGEARPQDGLDAKHESAVPEGDAQKLLCPECNGRPHAGPCWSPNPYGYPHG